MPGATVAFCHGAGPSSDIYSYYRDFALAARTPRERIVNQVQDGKRARFCSCCLPHFNFLANFNFLASMIILYHSERLFGVFLFIYFIFILNTFSISGF